MKIDPSKKWKSRGKPVLLLHRKPDGWPSPYVWEGVVDGVVQLWTENGEYYISKDLCGQDLDLVEDREPREWKATVLPTGALSMYAESDDSNPQLEVIRVREIIEP